MNNENMAVYPPYRLVAQFADGARLLFDGLTEAQAQQSMEAAQAQHGDIAWYDGVTDLHYENGKYYIFMEEEVGKYSVVLDTYTIDLPEFIEKYNSANEKTKVGLNIQKVFDAINNEDYEYVYNKLDNTFKQTNFKTVQELKNYVIQNFSGKQLKYGECQQQGSLYIFDITITEGTKQEVSFSVVMQLKEGTDFVMSFNVN